MGKRQRSKCVCVVLRLIVRLLAGYFLGSLTVYSVCKEDGGGRRVVGGGTSTSFVTFSLTTFQVSGGLSGRLSG